MHLIAGPFPGTLRPTLDFAPAVPFPCAVLCMVPVSFCLWHPDSLIVRHGFNCINIPLSEFGHFVKFLDFFFLN